MKILITGSTGMVGRNIIENPYMGQQNLLCPSSTELNLLNADDIIGYMRRHKPDMVIHCAGKVGGIQANMQDMYSFFTLNALMGINLVKTAKEQGIPHFLNLSSSCTYPCAHENPLKEDHVLEGKLESTNEGYALAKLSVQKMCEYISRECPGFQYKTLIPCNLYGRWDKFDEKNSHMISGVIKKIHDALKTNVREVVIWGDGKARREFMYAGDLAVCAAQAVQHFETLPVLMNVGLGFDYTINEYYETINKVLGYNGAFIHDTSKPVGMKQKLLDITRQTQWGFKPETSLEAGIGQAYQFFLEHSHD
ncbi:MAG: NAD-dependent epimerase/dehydratase family protein [Spirochaetaceae bacterium]|jgi:GDP-L-fucose synthase|nr:NAD-dependent epimerase/dehydratase family protein [Spirochaetaceae bacterium]